MKGLLFIALLAGTAFAQDKAANFDSMKQLNLTNIDQRMSVLQTHKSCVQAAATHDALKACHAAHKTARNALQEENKGERSAMKSARQAARKSKKP